MGEPSSYNIFELKFRVNREIFTLQETSNESDHMFKITNDNDYTVNYIKNLINSGYISLNEPLFSIHRIEDDENEETLIYPSFNENDAEANIDVVVSKVNKEICEWTNDETKLLLDLYEKFLPRVGPLKQFKTKKRMWTEIAELVNKELLCSKTSVQCENRYKTVLKRKKVAVDNNNKSGNSRQKIPFEDELQKIAAIDDSIEPEVVGTSHCIKILKQKNKIPPSSTDSSISGSETKKKKKNSVQDILLEIFERREEARERRHQEKLDLLRHLFGNENRKN